MNHEYYPKFIFEICWSYDEVQSQKSVILFPVKSRLTFKFEIFYSTYSIYS